MDQIRKYFEKYAKQTDKDWDLFSSRLSKQEFPKRAVILRTGQIERHLSFVQKGVIRFYLPKEGNDLTFSFVFANDFVSAYDSFLLQKPVTYCVETLTGCILWRVSYKDLQEIYQHTEVGNLIGRQASEDLFLKKSRRELSLLNETAEQRYLNLITEQPHLLREIPLKYIASYIGITPQALSRIRGRIS